MPVTVNAFGPDHPGWQAYADHLTRVNMIQHATLKGEPKPDGIYLGLSVEGAIVGHISLVKQPLVVPASYLCEDRALYLTDAASTPLYETFVQTFSVEAAHCRKGYGRALQEAAIEKSQEAGCYQMRSWSSADRRENYALKISLGFAMHPALYPMPGSAPLSGIYFIKRLT
jgi:GNAT superfamily N-acetyltransferase